MPITHSGMTTVYTQLHLHLVGEQILLDDTLLLKVMSLQIFPILITVPTVNDMLHSSCTAQRFSWSASDDLYISVLFPIIIS